MANATAELFRSVIKPSFKGIYRVRVSAEVQEILPDARKTKIANVAIRPVLQERAKESDLT